MYFYAFHLPACQVLDENCRTLHDTTLHDRLMEASNYRKMSLDISAGNITEFTYKPDPADIRLYRQRPR